jgi:uncharacterized protein YcfJ
MQSFGKIVATTALVMGLGTSAAYADGCSGRDHTNETILGAGAGALAGGLIGGDLAGAAVGGVAGGFIGNAIGRSQDCNAVRRQAAARRAATQRQAANRAYYVDRNGNRHYYER